MICVLVGLVPPSEAALDHLQKHMTNVDGNAVDWHESSHVEDADDGDMPTLLISAICEAQPDDVVASIDAELRNFSSSPIKCELWASAPCPLPLRPSGGYPVEISNGEDWLHRSTITMRQWGLLAQDSVLDTVQIAELRSLVDDAIAEAEAAFAQHRPEIHVGKDVFCFQEIASRSSERFDLRLQKSAAGQFVEKHVLSHPEVSALLQQMLGSLGELDFDISVVYSRPGAVHQGWHSDGNHQKGARDAGWDRDGWKMELADAYAICLFIPLIDLNDEVGYTQFWPGTHKHRDLIGFGKVSEIAEATFDGKCDAGDAIWYDYRLLHRGMPNVSPNVVRPVVQIIFKKKWYIERQNYGAESIVKGAG